MFCAIIINGVISVKVTNEPGVLLRSERFFLRRLRLLATCFYVTRVGHYYYDERYNFLDNCDTALQESHKNFSLPMCVQERYSFKQHKSFLLNVDKLP